MAAHIALATMDLPLFPLHLVLFPGRPIPLHLFEERYLLMLQACMAGDGQFGVVAIRSGREVGDVPPEVFRIGTVAEIESVTERPGGRYDLIARGVTRMRVVSSAHDLPYLHGEVELLEDPPCGPREREGAAELARLLVDYLATLGVPREYCDRLPGDPAKLGYLAASTVQVELHEQQQLLELPSHAERIAEVTRILRREAGFTRHLGSVASYKPPGPGGAQLN